MQAVNGNFGVQDQNGDWVLRFDLDTGDVDVNGDIEVVAKLFWKSIDIYANGSKNLIIVKHGDKEVIEIDPERRTIMHELWSPMASYIISELEKRG